MSVTPAASPVTRHGTGQGAASAAGDRRVRHQAQDVAAVMAFSLLASSALALALVGLTALAR